MAAINQNKGVEFRSQHPQSKTGSAILSPSRVGSPLILKGHNIPRQVLKLIPSRFWKLIPCRVRTSLPSFIQSYSSQGLITGLSSANCHGRSPSAKFFLSPAEFIKVPQHNLSTQSPAEFIIVIPSGVHHRNPQRSSHQNFSEVSLPTE